MRRLLVPFLATSLLTASPALAQAGQQRIQPITAQERQQGSQANAGITAEYGGALTGRQATYVEQVGRRIATQSGLSASPGAFNVTLLNSPVDNAFAVPGGYVYVTRNLVALMNDEAELAAVMGHEVAHVAARHSKSRERAATRNSILGTLGQVLVGAVAGNSTIGGLLSRGIGTGAQLATLGFSRGQETESDDLGIRYLSTAGYDTTALSTMLISLANQTQLNSQLAGQARSVPAWASTHPDPAARVRRAQEQAARAGGTGRLRNRDQFLAAIDGMIYGEDPKQGVIEGRTFRHPDLRIAFDVPQGFTMQNGTQAVTIQGQTAQGEFTTAQFNGNLDAYVGTVVGRLSGQGQASVQPQRTTVNGIPAAFTQVRAQSGQTPVDVTVFAYQLGPNQAFHFTTIAAAGRGTGGLDQTFTSFRRLSSTEAAQIRPRFVRVHTVRAGDTVQSLASRMAFADAPVERFLVLNRLDANARLQPGTKVKLVTY